MMKPYDIRFIPGGNFSKNFAESLDEEWLETNGLGGYAASTISRCATRKHHGLLVHPVKDLPGQFLMLSDLEPEPLYSGKEVSLGSNIYGRSQQSGGYQCLKEFKPFPNPSWLWENGEFSLREEMIMPQGQPRLLIRYRLSNGARPFKLRLKPLLGYRDSRGLASENGDITASFRSRRRELALTIYRGMPKIYFSFSGDYAFQFNPLWDRGVTYRKNTERGSDDSEDRFVPGFIFLELRPGKTYTLSVGISEFPLGSKGPEELFNEEKERRHLWQSRFSSYPSTLQLLGSRVDQFLCKNAKGEDTIVGGYYRWGEWCRDTMIALPGLTLSVGNLETAAKILEAHTSYIKKGLMLTIPGPGQKKPSYDFPDTALLYIAAIQAADPLLRGSRLYPGNREFEKRFYRPVKKILNAFLYNRAPSLRLEEDGLLAIREGEFRNSRGSTIAYGKPICQRHGKAVDINALWYNALRYFLELQKRLGKKPHKRVENLVLELPSVYRKTFWLPRSNCLADSITSEGPDTSLRSHVLLPLALPYSPLTKKERVGVLDKVEEELLTPMGIRTLSPKDSQFVPLYSSGDQEDLTYYQGAVLPGTLELYVQACLRTYPEDLNLRERLKKFLINLMEEHLLKNGLGSISEVFDGAQPKEGKGCVAHAGSAASILGSWDFLKNFPKG